MKDKILDAYYTLKYSLLNIVDSVRFGAEDLIYSLQNKLNKNDEFKVDVIEEVKPTKRKKKKSSKKKKK